MRVQINPRTTAKDLVKMLEETGTKVSISTVKRVLYWYSLKGRTARKKPLLQNCHKKSQTTVCNCTWGQMILIKTSSKYSVYVRTASYIHWRYGHRIKPQILTTVLMRPNQPIIGSQLNMEGGRRRKGRKRMERLCSGLRDEAAEGTLFLELCFFWRGPLQRGVLQQLMHTE